MLEAKTPTTEDIRTLYRFGDAKFIITTLFAELIHGYDKYLLELEPQLTRENWYRRTPEPPYVRTGDTFSKFQRIIRANKGDNDAHNMVLGAVERYCTEMFTEIIALWERSDSRFDVDKLLRHYADTFPRVRDDMVGAVSW